MGWRKITAEQYRVGGDASGDFDEAFIIDPDTGLRREVWDVGIDRTDDGSVVIYTCRAEPHIVPQDYKIAVR